MKMKMPKVGVSEETLKIADEESSFVVNVFLLVVFLCAMAFIGHKLNNPDGKFDSSTIKTTKVRLR